MNEVKNTASLQELIDADGDSKYTTVEAYGKTVRLKSLSSAEMIAWIESQSEPGKAKFAGIRLLVMSLAGPNDERIPEDQREVAVEAFKNKHAASNRAVIRAARELNGLADLGITLDALKNDSGRANTDASPIVSASSSVE